MDSMRSLNTHLPRSSTQSTVPQPSAELLQAFKSAALAVTQLYKTAASDGEKEAESGWSAGYQAALDELLRFLDQENLGLGDGEGWRVRQWATERLSAQTSRGNDADAEPSDSTQRGNDIATESSRQKSEDRADNAQESGSSMAPPPPSIQNFVSSPPASSQSHAPPSSQSFDFRSQIPMPYSPSISHNPDMEVDSAERGASAPPSHATPRSNKKKPLTREKMQTSAVLSQATLGQGAGVKRRLPLNEFFDISGLTSSKDWFDGVPSKKGRLS